MWVTTMPSPPNVGSRTPEGSYRARAMLRTSSTPPQRSCRRAEGSRVRAVAHRTGVRRRQAPTPNVASRAPVSSRRASARSAGSVWAVPATTIFPSGWIATARAASVPVPSGRRSTHRRRTSGRVTRRPCTARRPNRWCAGELCRRRRSSRRGRSRPSARPSRVSVPMSVRMVPASPKLGSSDPSAMKRARKNRERWSQVPVVTASRRRREPGPAGALRRSMRTSSPHLRRRSWDPSPRR